MFNDDFMTEENSWFNAIINDIEFKMIGRDDNCWIKVVPLTRLSIPSSLHIILNDVLHQWDIYYKNGREAHEVYFKGNNCTPCFYLKSGENSYRINCDKKGIKILPVTKVHTIDEFIKKNCNCVSSKASCWAKDVYYTSRPDKPPFDEM